MFVMLMRCVTQPVDVFEWGRGDFDLRLEQCRKLQHLSRLAVYGGIPSREYRFLTLLIDYQKCRCSGYSHRQWRP